jgi:Na+/proline symporter
MVQRYFTTATTKEAGRALWTHAWLTIPTQLLFFSLGTGLWLFFRQNPQLIDPTLRNDTVLPLFVVEMFPPGLKGVLIAGLFAASMSSLDSSMNSLSAVFVNDYYRRFAAHVTEEKALRLARFTTFLAGAFATLGAAYLIRQPDSPIFEKFVGFLGFVGGGLAAVFALGAFTKRANAAGALVGALLSGGLMYYVRTKTDINFIFYGFVSFASAFVVGYLVSILIGPGIPRLEGRDR